MCYQKIIKSSKFCILRIWQIISTTQFACYSTPPLTLHSSLSVVVFNRFCRENPFNQHNECWIFITGHSKIWCWLRKSGFYNKNPSRQWPLCLCSIFAWCGLINRWHYSCDQEMGEKSCLQATITYGAEHKYPCGSFLDWGIRIMRISVWGPQDLCSHGSRKLFSVLTCFTPVWPWSSAYPQGTQIEQWKSSQACYTRGISPHCFYGVLLRTATEVRSITIAFTVHESKAWHIVC